MKTIESECQKTKKYPKYQKIKFEYTPRYGIM